MSLGYLHPSGRVTCKKNWEYTDLLPKENTFNHLSIAKCYGQMICRIYGLEMPKQKPPQSSEKRLFIINKKAKGRIINGCYLLHYHKKHPLKWVTLTFHHDPGEIKNKSLKRFLKYLSHGTKAKKKSKSVAGILNNYIWVKELQKRGVIHYHILADMPYRKVELFREKWQSIIKQPTATRGFNIKIVRNSNLKYIINYMTKYMTKSSESHSEKFSDRCYGMSNAVNKQSLKIFDMEMMRNLRKKFNKKKNSSETDYYFSDYWKTAIINPKIAVKTYLETEKKMRKLS